MKKKSLLAIVSILALMLSLVFAACKKDPPSRGLPEGQESGTYYYDTADGEYFITLQNGDKFSFIVDGANKSGDYRLEGEKLILTFNKEEGKTETERESLEASYKDSVITLTYQNAQIRFLRKIDYKVDFITNGGSDVASFNVRNGRSITTPPKTEKSGHALIGWYNEEDFETVFEFGRQQITSATTLYARWGQTVGVEFTVDFDLGYDNLKLDGRTTIGGKLYNEPIPTREDQTFSGWWVSMYGDSDRLAYQWTSSTVFEEDTTLYALWRSNTASGLQAPLVQVNANSVSWGMITGVRGYKFEITTGSGHSVIPAEELSANVTSRAVPFSGYAAGDYIIKVTSLSTNPLLNSDETLRHYKNKALSRVSSFSVVDSTLIFNPVKNAANYSILVKCGDDLHNHTYFNNGNSTSYNFSSCQMREGGITFKVKAEAQGFVGSESREFAYDKVLNKIPGFYFDEATQSLSWSAVPNATNYIVRIAGIETDIGGATAYSLKEYAAGDIEIEVYPKTKGYNSPDPAIYKYTKTNLAAPRDIRIIGRTVSWMNIPNATYELKVGIVGALNPTVYQAHGENSYDLDSLALEGNIDYELSVMAKGNVTAQNSLWSDAIIIRDAMSELTYSQNTVSWRHVLGANEYTVYLNNQAVAVIEDGTNLAEITFMRAGTNTIRVNAFNGEIFSEASIQIFAHTVTFDSREGSPVKSQYKAVGDRISLPEGEEWSESISNEAEDTTAKLGYTLAGWYTSPGQLAARFNDSVLTQASDLVLFAFWNPNTYIVEYVYDEEPSGVLAEVIYGRDYTLEVPESVEDSGAAFMGWFSSPNGEGTPYTDDLGISLAPWNIAADGTLVYAYWAQALSFVLTEDGDAYAVAAGSQINLVTTLKIPTEYKGTDDEDALPVTHIADNAFANLAGLKSVTIPEGILSIGNNAFLNCTGLTELNLPLSLNDFKSDVLDGCLNIRNVNVTPGGLDYKSIDGVLFRIIGLDAQDKDLLELIYYPKSRAGSYTVPNTVTRIGLNAFQDAIRLYRITLPESLTSIAAYAFDNCWGLVDVKIPGNVTEIGGNAFKGCINLRSVTFAELGRLTRIEEAVFENCTGLTTITIPISVTSIGERAFDSCFNLTKINIPNTVTVIGNRAFQNCTSLSEVFIAENGASELTIGLGDIFEGSYVFRNCHELKTIHIPNHVTEITPHSFTSSGIEVVTFQSGGDLRLTIGGYAFEYCASLREISFPARLSGYDYMYNPDGSNPQQRHMPAIDQRAFAGCVNLTVLGFAPGGTGPLTFSVGDDVFGGCVNIEVLDIVKRLSINDVSSLRSRFPSNKFKQFNVESGHISFSDIDGVLYNAAKTELLLYPMGRTDRGYTFPDGVTAINGGAFKDAVAIESLTIPTGVTVINVNTFQNMTALSSITLHNGITDIGDNAFAGTGLVGITLPADLSDLGDAVFQNCAKLQSVTFPSAVTLGLFGDDLFNGCVKLDSLQIPASVTSISDSAFISCVSLTGFTVAGGINFSAEGGVLYDYAKTTLMIYPLGKTDTAYTVSSATVTTIGANAFRENSKIVNLTLADTVKTLGDNAFRNCINLESITVPGITSIGQNAFNGSMKLTSINLPQTGLTSIGAYAFAGSGLATVTLPDAVRTIGSNAFEDCVNLKRVIAGGVVSIGASAFSGNVEMESITLPEDGMNSGGFGEYAFAGSGLKSITIPTGITNLPRGVFDGCNQLATVNFPETGFTTVGVWAFRNCTSLVNIVLPSTIGSSGIQVYAVERGNVVGQYGGIGDWRHELHGNPFMGCSSLVSISFNGTNNNFRSIDGVIFSANGSTLMVFPGGKTDHYTIPSNVTAVAPYAFAGASSLTELTFPGTFSNSGYSMYMFKGNTSIKKINILSSTLTTFGKNYAFTDMYALEEINLPSTFTTFGDECFRNANFNEFTVKSNMFISAGWLFQGNKNLETVIFEERTTNLNIGQSVFEDCAKLRNIVLPMDRTRGLGPNTFANCTSIKSLVIPVSVVSFGERIFEGWTEEQTIYMQGRYAPSPGGNWNENWLAGCNAKIVWGWEAE